MFVCWGIRQSLGNFQGKLWQEYCFILRQNMVTNVAFMEKIYKQAVTHVYWRKYHQSLRRLYVYLEKIYCVLRAFKHWFSETLSLWTPGANGKLPWGS